jgi:hypothetical protein
MIAPLEFRCPNCQQRLSAKAEKVGRRVKCPRCGGSLIVPADIVEETFPPVNHDVGQAHLPATDPSGQFPSSIDLSSSAITSPDATGDAELPVIVLDEEFPPPSPRVLAAEPFDPTWVSFPRRVIYVHAATLALLLAGAFGLGYLVGHDHRPSAVSAPQSSAPIALDGRVTYPGPNFDQIGDDGSVVIALPRAARPGRTEKPSLAGLGPLDPAPADNDPVVEALAALGGVYLRTDNEGRFRMVLPQSGEYYLLYISRHATRENNNPIRREHLAEMGEYFTSSLELVGRQQYAWSLRTLDPESNVDHTFR